uniref:Putative replicase n=1 Tax=Patsystermes virus TaxID=2796625 RepID=A0A7T7GUV0_9VIRU|nr:putative replicase [Patsystermes virus]
MSSRSESTGDSGTHSAPVIKFPLEASDLRTRVLSGSHDPRILGNWLKQFSMYLISEGILSDDAAGERFQRFNMRQLVGATTDLKAHLFIVGEKVLGTHHGKNRVEYIRDSDANVGGRFDTIARASWSRSGFKTNADSLYSEVEGDNKDKMGPRSVYLPWHLDGRQKCDHLMTEKHPGPGFDYTVFREALSILKDWIKGRTVNFQPYRDVVSGVPNGAAGDDLARDADPNTNSGEPFDLHGWKPTEGLSAKENASRKIAFDYYVSRAEVERDYYLKGQSLYGYSLFNIRHNVSHGPRPLDSEKTKRVVNMMPKSDMFHARQFLWALQDEMKKVVRMGEISALTNVAWMDLPAIDLEMRRAYNFCAKYGYSIVSADYSGFDASLVADLVVELGSTIGSFIKDGGYFIQSYFHTVMSNTGFVTPTEVYVPQPSGIKSGSGVTNLVDTLMNMCVAIYGELVGKWKLAMFYAQGDDAVIAGPGVDPQSYQEIAALFNFTANPDKQFYSQANVQYLQRMHGEGIFGGVFSTFRALNSSFHLENLKYHGDEWNPYAQAVQVISKLANASFNPAFEELVNYVKQADAFKLGADLPAAQVVKRGGTAAEQMLHERDYIAANVTTAEGWEQNPVNLVLRGGTLPPVGSKQRFAAVYGQERVRAAEALVGISADKVFKGGF